MTGPLAVPDEDEITRKPAMLVEGTREGLGPTRAARKYGYSRTRYYQPLNIAKCLTRFAMPPLICLPEPPSRLSGMRSAQSQPRLRLPSGRYVPPGLSGCGGHGVGQACPVVGLSPPYLDSTVIRQLTYHRVSRVMLTDRAPSVKTSAPFREKCLTASPAGGNLGALRLQAPGERDRRRTISSARLAEQN